MNGTSNGAPATAPTNGHGAANGLPEAITRRGISQAQWNTLCRSLYPGAAQASIVLVIDYCAARKLDPLKKPCHIVPMEVKDAKTGKYEWRDVVMPGVYELRTTAQRTGEYMGHGKPIYGPPIEHAGVEAPEWIDLTVYRWNRVANQRVEFPVTVFFREAVATKRDGDANARWSRAPIQMLTKCAEAAALREAFPDEIGGEQTAEELDGQRAIDAPVVETRLLPSKPEKFDDWLHDLESVASEGAARLAATWEASDATFRRYLTATTPEKWEALKARGDGVAADVVVEDLQ